MPAAVLYCTLLYYIVLNCTVLYCTVLHCTVLKVVACQQLLGLLDVVSPGLSLGRGLVLYELHSALVMLANTEYAYSHDRCRGGHFTDYFGWGNKYFR